mmetsp:Transcript_1793/g.4086  ORF Transcript_1793/g.4086 Transcript_1793/m.4086 type:complete len:209 (+) Transcript_1793:299-925(+)
MSWGRYMMAQLAITFWAIVCAIFRDWPAHEALKSGFEVLWPPSSSSKKRFFFGAIVRARLSWCPTPPSSVEPARDFGVEPGVPEPVEDPKRPPVIGESRAASSGSASGIGASILSVDPRVRSAENTLPFFSTVPDGMSSEMDGPASEASRASSTAPGSSTHGPASELGDGPASHPSGPDEPAAGVAAGVARGIAVTARESVWVVESPA